MKLEGLLQIDMGSASEWLIENQHLYELVPRVPTTAMREAFWEAHDEYEDGIADGPDHQWQAMISAWREDSFNN